MQTIKQAINGRIVAWINNPHTSTAGLVWLFLKLGVPFFWPEYAAKADTAADMAVAYGLLTAVDTKHKPPNANETQTQ